MQSERSSYQLVEDKDSIYTNSEIVTQHFILLQNIIPIIK